MKSNYGLKSIRAISKGYDIIVEERISLHLKTSLARWSKRKKSIETVTSNEGLTSFTCGLLTMFLALDAYLSVLIVSL
jgi:hypothetical protein